MVSLKLLPPLTRLVGEKVIAVDVDRAPLKTVIELAMAQNAKFRIALLDPGGNLSSEYSCVVRDQRYNIADLDSVDVADGDEIVILLPLAGGS